jgi:hypothetical protein
LIQPEKLRPSLYLHFTGISIISTIVFITDMVHQVLAKFTCPHPAMVYRCKTTIDSIHAFRTKLATEIRKIVPWVLAMDRFTCPTHDCEVSSKFPCCLFVVLTMNLEVQVLICRDWNCGSYLLGILLWHTKNWNEKLIIHWQNQPDIHCPNCNGHSALAVGLENRRV